MPIAIAEAKLVNNSDCRFRSPCSAKLTPSGKF
jgi:hypothetical protein